MCILLFTGKKFVVHFCFLMCLPDITFLTQILCIDGTPVRDMEHSIVVELFQSCDKMKICYLPSKFKEVSCI